MKSCLFGKSLQQIVLDISFNCFRNQFWKYLLKIRSYLCKFLQKEYTTVLFWTNCLMKKLHAKNYFLIFKVKMNGSTTNGRNKMIAAIWSPVVWSQTIWSYCIQGLRPSVPAHSHLLNKGRPQIKYTSKLSKQSNNNQSN